MNHEDYKELLATAALDLLTEAERAELAAHTASCDECLRELREMRDAAALLAYAVAPIAPPAALRARILENIRQPENLSLAKGRHEAERGGSNGQGETSPKVLTLPLKAEENRRNFLGKRSTVAFGALAAAVMLALIIPLALLWKRNNELRAELARRTQDLQTTQAELARASERPSEAQTGITDEGGRVEPTPTPAPPTTEATPPPARANEGTQVSRPPQRDDGRQTAEIARLLNRNNELQAQLAQSSTRANELQAELARTARGTSEAQTQLAALTNQNAELQSELTRLRARNAELQTQTASFSTRNDELQRELTGLSRRYDELQNRIARRAADTPIAAPDARVVALAGTKEARGARGNLVYTESTGGVTLFASGLPPAPPGKAYQLWLIAGGKPVSGGVFTTDERGRASLRSQVSPGGRKLSAFAVTLEQAGGVAKPTGDKYLVGSVR